MVEHISIKEVIKTDKNVSLKTETKESSDHFLSLLLQKSEETEGESTSLLETLLNNDFEQVQDDTTSEEISDTFFSKIGQFIEQEDVKEKTVEVVKKILLSQANQKETLFSEGEIKEIKESSSLKELITLAQKKGLNIESIVAEALQAVNKSVSTVQEAQTDTLLRHMKKEESKSSSSELSISLKDETKEIKKEVSTLLKTSSVTSNEVKESVESKPLTLEQVVKELTQKENKTSTKKSEAVYVESKESGVKESVDSLSKEEGKENTSRVSKIAQEVQKNESVLTEVAQTSRKDVLKSELKEGVSQDKSRESVIQSDIKKEVGVKIDDRLKGSESTKVLTEASQTLEEEISEESTQKVATKTTQKAETTMQTMQSDSSLSLMSTSSINEVKYKSINATQTLNHFSSSLQEAIKEYKPPISKLSIELNPENLGKVDVTIAQRGNSIQVSMNTAQSNVALFMQNQADFKAALSNIGFSDVDMSFNSNQKEQQNRQQQAAKTYDSHQEEAINDIEITATLSYEYA